MVYGHTPFSQLTMYQKIQCIPNPQYLINFPTVAVPTPSADEPHPAPDNGVPVESDLLRVMKTCLQRDSKLRLTIPELLEDPFLRPGSAPRVRNLGVWGDENAVPPVPPVPVMEDIVRQVLTYGERRRQGGVDVARMNDTEVERVAKVCNLRFVSFRFVFFFSLFLSFFLSSFVLFYFIFLEELFAGLVKHIFKPLNTYLIIYILNI